MNKKMQMAALLVFAESAAIEMGYSSLDMAIKDMEAMTCEHEWETLNCLDASITACKACGCEKHE